MAFINGEVVNLRSFCILKSRVRHPELFQVVSKFTTPRFLAFSFFFFRNEKLRSFQHASKGLRDPRARRGRCGVKRKLPDLEGATCCNECLHDAFLGPFSREVSFGVGPRRIFWFFRWRLEGGEAHPWNLTLLHLKIDAWKTTFPFGDWPMLVLGSVNVFSDLRRLFFFGGGQFN